MRAYWLLAVAVALVGCGSESVVSAPAEPRTFELDWVEESRESGLAFRVDRLVVRPDGWEVTASVANRSSAGYAIRRPHRPGESMFGLVLLETESGEEVRELTADFRKAPPFVEPNRIEPPLPRVLSPGSRWRGKMSGSTTLREGAALRILFGRFERTRGDPGYLLWVTRHAVRLAPEGA
jgi:hypothetical protein